MSMLSEALDYARRGWWVFPCREKPGHPFTNKDGQEITPTEKQPYTAKGLHDATLDEDQIVAWWTKWPDAMIGINAGKSGLFVVDIDKKHADGLDTFTRWNINDSAGLHSITPSGGMHLVFTGMGKSSTNAKTGIDTRGEGGYFVAPPSKIVEGVYTGEYKRFDDWGKQPGVIPDGLLVKLFPETTTEYTRGAAFVPASGEYKQLSRNTLNFLANGALSGERNSTLFKALADFHGCFYDKEYTRVTVWPVAERIGLGKSEFEQVLDHAYAKERTSSIPDSIQKKIAEGGKNIASKITAEEQAVLEDALLACLLIDNALIPVIQDILNYDDFQIFRNRVIYKAINRLHSNGMKIDYLTVGNEVNKETDKIKLDDISKMINQYFVNTDHVLTYAHIVKEKASVRKIEAILDNKSKYMKGKNLSETIGLLEKDVADVAVYGGTKTTTVLDSQQATEMVIERTRKLMSGEIEQLKVGFYEYDNNIGGLFPDDFVICAGYAGEGKSALALSVAHNIAINNNKRVLVFSLEMSTHENICRLVCQMTGISYRKIYTGKMTTDEWKEYREAMDKIASSHIYWDDGFAMTVPEIRSKIRTHMEKDGLDLIMVDQLEQVKGHDGVADHIRFNAIAYEFKDVSKEFGIPLWLNHQLNRTSQSRQFKNTEIQLTDLNQAGEKPSTQIWGISHYKDEKGNILQSKIKLLKNRNGAKIDFALTFLGQRMLFANPTREEDKQPFPTVNEGDEPGWSRNGQFH